MDKPWIKYVFIAFAIVAGFLLRWYFEPAPKNNTGSAQSALVAKHEIDSVKYIVKIDSLSLVVDSLKERIEYSSQKIYQLKNQFLKQKQDVKLLPAGETVAYFNCSTGDTAKMVVIGPDTMAVATIPGIKAANLLFVDANGCFEISKQLEGKIGDLGDLISVKDKMLSVKDVYIKDLNDQYFASGKIIKDQDELIGKQKKVIKRKNVIMGLFGGIAAASIVIIAIR
jgi:hypothetical protein